MLSKLWTSSTISMSTDDTRFQRRIAPELIISKPFLPQKVSTMRPPAAISMDLNLKKFEKSCLKCLAYVSST